MKKSIALVIVALSVIFVSLTSAADLKILTDRSDFHLTKIVKDFEKKTGKTVELTFVKKGIIERAQSGDYNIMISKDSSEVIAAKQMGMLQPLPASLYHDLTVDFKDAESYKWFIMSYRIRAIHVKNDIKDAPMSYEDLAKPQYKGRICTRSHTHNYNLELYGTLLKDMGKDKFTKWFKAFDSNLARVPAGNDRNQVKGVFQGECDIAIANTYYRGLMLDNPEQKPWADATTMIIPNQGVNDSGAIALFAGVGTLSDNPLVTEFYKFILSDDVQKGLSLHNYEYPLEVKNVSPTVYKYGSEQGLNFSTIKLHENIQDKLYNLRKEAYKIVKSSK